jgi:hypothetical protein
LVLPLPLLGRQVHASSHSRQAQLTTIKTEITIMSGTQRDQIAKNESGKKASKASQGKSGLNGILETVRQKMSYTLRGI